MTITNCNFVTGPSDDIGDVTSEDSGTPSPQNYVGTVRSHGVSPKVIFSAAKPTSSVIVSGGGRLNCDSKIHSECDSKNASDCDIKKSVHLSHNMTAKSCHVCQDTFGSPGEFGRHLSTIPHLKRAQHSCANCGIGFLSNDQLRVSKDQNLNNLNKHK